MKQIVMTVFAIIVSATWALGQRRAPAYTAGSYEAFKLQHATSVATARIVEGPKLGGSPQVGDTGRLPYGKFHVAEILGPDQARGFYQWPTATGAPKQPAVLSGISTEGVADGYAITVTNMLTVAGTRKVQTLGGERTLIELRPAVPQ